MWPIALVLSSAVSLLALLGLSVELDHVRADTAQQSQRYATGVLATAESAFATQFGAVIQSGGAQASPIPSTSPSPLCPTSVGLGVNQQRCNYYGSYSVALEGSSTSVGAGGTNESSTNVNLGAGEIRWAAFATATVTNSAGVVLAQRQRKFTVRSYGTGYDTFGGAVLENSTDQEGSVSTDGDIAGCAGPNGGNTNCGDNTQTKAYVYCNSSPAPDPTAQRWENATCTNWTAPMASPSPGATLLPADIYTNPNWNNRNASGTPGWSP